MKLSEVTWRLRVASIIGAGSGALIGRWLVHDWLAALALAVLGAFVGLMLAPFGSRVIERD